MAILQGEREKVKDLRTNILKNKGNDKDAVRAKLVEEFVQGRGKRLCIVSQRHIL